MLTICSGGSSGPTVARGGCLDGESFIDEEANTCILAINLLVCTCGGRGPGEIDGRGVECVGRVWR
jgi:hypothetical protein